MQDKDRQQPPWLIPVACCLLAVAMAGLSLASVPLHDWFQRTTGHGGIAGKATDRADTLTISDREVTISFDANVGEGVNLHFMPGQASMQLHVGEQAVARYITENPGEEPFHGMATFQVTPGRVASYVSKIECFCFSEHRLDAGESIEMPVSFYIDPAIEEDAEMDDIHAITFSYTFFETAPWSNETEKDS